MKFKNLTKEQIEQVQFQIAAHQHVDYEVDIYLNSKKRLEDFRVFSGVMRPELMTSLKFAQFLFIQTELDFKGKICWDMGCGCGILGIVLALRQAKLVYFSDISSSAIFNTNYNIQKEFSPKIIARSMIYEGDLFDNLKDLTAKPIFNLPELDYIIFNHPFFADDPPPEYPISTAMLDNGQLLKRFFETCKAKFRDAIIIMPFFKFADFPDNTSKISNNPEKIARNNGFEVQILKDPEANKECNMGLQNGGIDFFKIFRKK